MNKTVRESISRIGYAIEAVKISQAFESAGLGVAILKGAVLGEVAYGGVENRASVDIDLLVKPGELRRAGFLLEGRGYRMVGGSPSRLAEGCNARGGAIPTEVSFRNEKTGGMVELHPRIAPLAMMPAFDEDRIWDRLEPVRICGVPTITTGTIDTLLHLAFNGLKHGWCSVRYATDFAKYAQAKAGPGDLEQVLSESHARGCRRMVLIAAWLAVRTGEWALPDQFRQALAADPQAVTIARRYAAAMDQDPDAEFPMLQRMFGMRHSWDSRSLQARWLARQVFTPNPEDYGWVRLPAFLGVLYYFIRPVRLTWQWLPRPVVARFKHID